MVESPLQTAISRASHVSRQLTAGFPLQGYQYQTATVLPTPKHVNCVPEPTFRSLPHPAPATTTPHTLYLSAPLCFSSHQQPWLPWTPGRPAPSTSFDWPRDQQLVGFGAAAASVDYGGVEVAYQGGIIARGRQRGTDVNDLAKIKQIQTPRTLPEQHWRRKMYLLHTADSCLHLVSGERRRKECH